MGKIKKKTSSRLSFRVLRKKYPQFIYKSYSWAINKRNLKISFLFEIEPEICFNPELVIKNIDKAMIKKIDEKILNNLIFHLGLIEMLSYWKVTCSPEIIVKAGFLNKEQIGWWKNLIIKGMGQFFYENKINFLEKNFLTIKTEKSKIGQKYAGELKNQYLVPIGGGKDSIVTLEKLIQKKGRKKIACFFVNPSKKVSQKIVKISKIKNSIIVKRKIDPYLLKLNKKGYLNGHVPFTALLSFLSLFCATLFNYKNIVFSNEKSADEGNVKYLGKTINHQWSKSSEFEKKFQKYCKKYLVSNINYFSFLRKYGELEIAKMFVKYKKYFPVFSSCNAVKAKKLKKRWCGSCPKCLFVYLLLYPFLEKDEILKIFGKDLFKDKKLLPIMRDLLGRGKTKPFECVGTYKESGKVFKLSFEKIKKSEKKPFYGILKDYKDEAG